MGWTTFFAVVIVVTLAWFSFKLIGGLMELWEAIKRARRRKLALKKRVRMENLLNGRREAEAQMAHLRKHWHGYCVRRLWGSIPMSAESKIPGYSLWEVPPD